MQFPPEINSHIAGFIADEVRGADPQCYRSARSLQAAWRGWLTRTHILHHVYDLYHNMCERCDENMCTQRVFGGPEPRPVWTCDACSVLTDRLDLTSGPDLHNISIFPASYTEPFFNGSGEGWQFMD